jgi:serine/threonine-protein kinase
MGIHHRDIKPENLFLTTDGRVKVGDFGAAKMGDVADTSKTIKGTHSYISPAKHEAMNSPDGVVYEDTGKGDVWSLGVTFLQMAILEKPTHVNNKSMGHKRVLNYLKKTHMY